MNRLRRLITLLCFAGLLTVVGVPVYFHVRYTPRCTISAEFEILALSSDGRSLLVRDATPRKMPDDEEDPHGPRERFHIKLLDASTGQVVLTFDNLFERPTPVNHRDFVFHQNRDLCVLDLDRRDLWKSANTRPSPAAPLAEPLRVVIGDEPALVYLHSRRLVRYTEIDDGAAVPGTPINGPIPAHHDRVILDEDSQKPIATRFSTSAEDDVGTCFLASLDRRWIALGPRPNIGWIMVDTLDPHAVFKRCDLWGTAPLRPIVSWESAPGGSPVTLVMSANSRSVVLWRRSNGVCELKLLELAADKETSFVLPAQWNNSDEDEKPFGFGRFSPDGRYFVLSHWHGLEGG